MKSLLDTHILLWWLGDARLLSRAQHAAIQEARPESPLLVAGITLWEVATLHELGRIRLALPLREWLEQATAPPLVERCDLTPAIASELATFPKSFHRDPADRIIVATARVLGATLLTSDERIHKSGLVPTLG
ncbi:MAG: type II toxin-antitoxin system VapC family toxin [Candidatus Riflebacteria bacterium]|nr:type II toxin-antitoxin system VapC family toxin [Candidatus Riflebacteria bacterium]